MNRESLADWADLHGHTSEPVPPPAPEHCDRHGQWTPRAHWDDECPQCVAAYDLLDRGDAWHDNPYRT